MTSSETIFGNLMLIGEESELWLTMKFTIIPVVVGEDEDPLKCLSSKLDLKWILCYSSAPSRDDYYG